MGLIGEQNKQTQRNQNKEFLFFFLSYLFNDSKNRYSKLKRICISGKCEVGIFVLVFIFRAFNYSIFQSNYVEYIYRKHLFRSFPRRKHDRSGALSLSKQTILVYT